MNTDQQTFAAPDALSPGALSPDDGGPMPGGVGETVLFQLGRCIGRLEDPALRPSWVVHEVRKDLKRVRALLRLCGDVLPTRRLGNKCGRVARRLAHLRDADAIGETLSRLRARADARQLDALDALAAELAMERETGIHDHGLPRETANELADALSKVRHGVQVLSFARLDDAALARGMAISRAETAAAFQRVADRRAMPRFHEFRKAVKRELHQRELSGRPVDRMERATLKKLAEVLGELQDLDVLRHALRDRGSWRGPVRSLVSQTIRELKARALRLGAGRYPEEGPRGGRPRSRARRQRS